MWAADIDKFADDILSRKQVLNLIMKQRKHHLAKLIATGRTLRFLNYGSAFDTVDQSIMRLNERRQIDPSHKCFRQIFHVYGILSRI